METAHHIVHILLIEDDRDDVDIFDEVIHDMDSTTEITVLKSCNDILNVLPTLANFPDFVFLDVNLPGKSGIECIQDIKANPLYSHSKVIVYCGIITQSIRNEALRKGADLCVVKPSTIQEIHDLLQHIIYPA